MKRWQLVAIVLVLLFVLGGAADTVIGKVTNGPIVGPVTTVGDDGLVDGDPAELAAAAGLDVDTYALARCMASEHPTDPDVYLFAIGWAVRNYAAERGLSVVELLTGGRGTAGDGYFGAQNASAGTKYASTARDPRQRHVDAAQAVISGYVPDPTGGATHFFSPQTQDWLAEHKGAKDSETIMRTWAAPGGLYASGAVPVVPDGIDPRRLTLWRQA
jgi:hypothetical protein